jgi:hypothetical protein
VRATGAVAQSLAHGGELLGRPAAYGQREVAAGGLDSSGLSSKSQEAAAASEQVPWAHIVTEAALAGVVAWSAGSGARATAPWFQWQGTRRMAEDQARAAAAPTTCPTSMQWVALVWAPATWTLAARTLGVRANGSLDAEAA